MVMAIASYRRVRRHLLRFNRYSSRSRPTIQWLHEYRLHYPVSDANGSRPQGAAGSAGVELHNLDWGVWSLAEIQPSPISTAIRIRSEWFLAPSFCLSRDVVLATVL